MIGAQTALVAMVVLPATVGGALAVLRSGRGAAPIALITSAIMVALSLVTALTRPTVSYPFVVGADFALDVDALAALVVPMITTVTFLVLIFAAGNIRESRGRFHGLMLIFAAAALVTATAASIPALLFAWEVMGATSYALIGFWWRDPDRVSAGLTAFITTRTADLGLYISAGAALAGGAGMALADLPNAQGSWRHVAAAGIVVAALGKAAQLPFSFWLSGAMKGPSPVSALLHSAAMVAMGGYLLLRVEPLLASTAWAGPLTAWAGVSTAVLMGVVALAQRELKQLLAASTAAQLGFVVLAAGVGTVSGGAAHLVAHAWVKALLFLAAGAWLTALGTEELAKLRGVARRWPVVGVTAGVAALALAGVAPLSLWATKEAVLTAALKSSPWLYAAGLLAAALSAAYAGKALWAIWRRDSRAGVRADGTTDVSTLEQAPLVLLALGAAVLGLLVLPPIGGMLAEAVGGHGTMPAVELVVSAVIAVVIVLLMLRLRAPAPRWALGWLGLASAAQAVVVRPSMTVARTLARFDDDVLDRSVHALARQVLGLAQRAARVDDLVLDRAVTALTGATAVLARMAARVDDLLVDGAVASLAGQVRRLGRLARAPQTGAIHQYFLQTIAVLAIGVVVWSVYSVMG